MASSSKKKSSKKKTSKLSYKTRRMKKTPKNASKKIGRRHDSSSEDSIRQQSVSLPSDSNSDNDSISSLSSSEGTYRSKKKGSSLKKKIKSRASRRSSSSEDLTSGRKRKRLRKRKGHSESKKKSQKKKPRRHARISSASSDSSSCSTCKSNSTSEEGDLPKHKTKLKKNKKRRVESKTETILNKERTDRSPDGSSDCRSRDQSYIVSHGGENFAGENKSRRLKSVITVVVRPYDEEENTLEKDILKEKAVCDLDDFPSSKSVDTTGTRSTRNPPPHSPAASDCKRRMEDFSGGGSSSITQRVIEPSGCSDIAQDIQYPLQDELKNDYEKDSSANFLPDDGPGGNDLEAILRRKALENLKKFRVKTDVKTIGNESKIDDVSVNQLSTSKKVVVERRLPELVISNVNTNVSGIKLDDAYTSQLATGKDVVAGRRLAELGSTNVKTNGAEVKKDDVNANLLSTAKEKVVGRRFAHLGSSNVTGRAIINESVKPPFNRDGPRPALSGQNISDGRFTDKKFEAGKVNTIDPLDKLAHFVNPIKEHATSRAFDPKSESSNLLRKGKHSGMQSTANLKTTSVSSDKELTVNKVTETDSSPIINDDHQKKSREVTAPSSATSSATEELTSGVQCAPQGQSSNEQKNETKGGSDFKEKKMTVMKGGEMVEVSYKVYIPQRSPALARRQLNR